MQGDSNAGKILAVGVDDMESAPKSIDLQLKNFDKDFSVTADRVESRIYSVFEQVKYSEVCFFLKFVRVVFLEIVYKILIYYPASSSSALNKLWQR